MRLFVSYGFNERDKWIEQLVFPLIEALGCEIVTGQVMYGSELTSEVREAIERSDALIAFLTRREQRDGRWTTHRWVADELAMATALDKPVVEIREEGVETSAGPLSRQEINYQEDAKDRCLVQIAQAVGQVRERSAYIRLKLGPQEFVDEIRPLLARPGLRCVYSVMSANHESPQREARIRRLAGSLYVVVQGIKHGDFLQVRVSVADKVWSSDYERVDDISISLKEEPM